MGYFDSLIIKREKNKKEHGSMLGVRIKREFLLFLNLFIYFLFFLIILKKNQPLTWEKDAPFTKPQKIKCST